MHSVVKGFTLGCNGVDFPPSSMDISKFTEIQISPIEVGVNGSTRSVCMQSHVERH